ncbi:hypothetical protein ABH921_001957 [Kocuria sp. MT07]|uniref:DUF2971 domain-containing protein n=1 Tax=Kocuria TaxID=57493 RepID=UPI0011A4F3D1|nr:DUF2971 domain-containing protein [Kocuria rhizophila]WSY88624.1 DUF2971 domain-containing protein [Kocuria rhizophila]WSZ54052.1 DUF2971 domain-containing protein [Kocuria rhizophila]
MEATLLLLKIEIMNQLNFDMPLILDTPTGMRTTVYRSIHAVDRPPLTVQSGRAWHYTSLSALRSILQGQQLWATSWRETNDRTEFRHGIEFLQQAWERHSRENPLADPTRELLEQAGPFKGYTDHFEHVNILCAARERDSPYQWNSYATGPEGLALGIDLGVELVTDIDDRPRRTGQAELLGMQWLKVVYTDRQKQLTAARFVGEMDDLLRRTTDLDLSSFVALNLLTALNFKHLGFRHEKETRCVSLSAGVELQVMPATTQKTIVPWKGLPLQATPATAERRPLPIGEIVVGPRATEETIATVSQCLIDADMSAVPVERSELPFR